MTQTTEQKTLLSLKNDAVCKLFFANEENEEQLKQFLKATTHLADDDLVTVEIKNPKLTKQHVQEKDFIVDIHLTSATGQRIIIEMQIRNHKGFIDRMVSYNARQYASQLNRGEDYTKLKASISLVITDFEVFDDTDEFYEYITFRRENRKIFTKAQQFYIIDLTKLPDDLTEAKHKWGALFKAKTEEELTVLMDESKEMKEAGKKLLKLSADEEAREIAEAREMSQWAWKYTLHATEEAGFERGFERGIEEERKKMVVNLLAIDTPINDIVKVTGLTENEILKLDKRS